MSGEPTPGKQTLKAPWQPGQSGNPNGRPKGARNRLGEAFIMALAEDFERDGVAAIVEVREEKPDQYLKVIASLLPKELTLNFGDDRGELTDDELIERIRILTETVSPLLIGGAGRPEVAIADQTGTKKPAGLH